MYDFTIAFAIALAGFALQVWPRLLNRYFGIDTWRFALLADAIRRTGRFPESVPEKYLAPGFVDNPPLLPYICSLFPKNWLDRNQGLLSPAFDVLQSLTVYALGYAVSGAAIGGHLAQIFYLLTPVVPLEASNLSLRTLGSLVFLWAMLAIQAYALHPGVWTFLLGVAGVTLLTFTHRMAMQVLFFALIGFTIVDSSARYLLVFLVGVLFSIFAFRGAYLKALRGQLLMIAYWMYNIENRLAHQIRGNPTREKKHTDFVRRIEYLIWRIPVLPFLAINPWTIYAGIALLLPDYGAMAAASPWFSVAVKWSVILFVLGILFNTKYMRFLGEGQRYLEYATGATAAAAAAMVLKFAPDPAVWGLAKAAPWIVAAGCLGVILFFQIKLVVKNPDKSVTPALWAVLDFLNAFPGEVRIACLPHGLSDAVTYFLKNGKALLSDNSVGVYELSEYWPLLKRPLREFADRYALTHLLVSTRYVTLEELDLPDFHEVFRREHYVVLARNEAA
jgi:hypothetical protein